MNDPHVEALIYYVMHGKGISYEKSAPFTHETADFFVRIATVEARFEMKQHFATVNAAREIVEPFIRKWELHTVLERGPGEFQLRYKTADIVDRNPTPLPPGQHFVTASAVLNISTSMSAVVRRVQYPPPCDNFGVNADIEALILRYGRYREDRGTLADVGNLCLTVLEKAAGGRTAAAVKFGVSSQVLKKMGRLTSEHGGLEARKSIGFTAPFSSSEREWLEAAVKRLIRRAAEVAHDPSNPRPPITMANLQQLI